MSQRENIRRLAMQVLYQIDLTGEADAEVLLDRMDAEHDPLAVRTAAIELATAAWQAREEADKLVAALAPDWPTHRQPPVDKAILRLAIYEMSSGRTPGRVAINEAIKLAKLYCTEQAPPFINGVLDKAYKRLDLPEPPATTAATPAADDWLNDAVEKQ
jgi:N utilization substance protein B